MAQKDPCQNDTCEIQKCLQASNSMTSRCEAAIQEIGRDDVQYPSIGLSLRVPGSKPGEEEHVPQLMWLV
uniref:Uncharacterized protein n=1 Tax=Anolis carolinensis TaxID=28377 RepID=A0A803TJW4_ANOCA